MKVDTQQTSQQIENKDFNIQLDDEDEAMLIPANGTFADIISSQLLTASTSEETLPDIDFNYDSVSMSLQDAMFFVNLAQNGQFSIAVQNGEQPVINSIDLSQNTITQKNVEVTNQLTTLIEKAQNTQKPVRISFDNDVSVILKIDKHGKLTAEFIPGNTEVENYLRNNISSLKQKFDEQNLPYNDLLYKQNNKQNRNKKQNKGEH
ncbi:MAG: hypothetical protein LUG16_00045 [Candidatus Gastranaerophilales bacterium]|nr:hypothetical protein [Candidatus Gastranaerophilales bacterium]